MTRDELNTTLLYQINDKLNGLMCIIADYVITNGHMSNESLDHIKETVGNAYNELEAAYKAMEAVNKNEAEAE